MNLARGMVCGGEASFIDLRDVCGGEAVLTQTRGMGGRHNAHTVLYLAGGMRQWAACLHKPPR